MQLAPLLITLAWSASAIADDVRGQGFMFDFHGGAGALQDRSTAPAVTYGLGLAYAIDQAATAAAGVELLGMTSWSQGVRLDRGGAVATFTVWFDDQVSLKVGAGVASGAAVTGDGFVALGRVGYEVKRWKRSALVLSLDVTEETSAGPQINALVGFDIFSHESTMNLWTPPPANRPPGP